MHDTVDLRRTGRTGSTGISLYVCVVPPLDFIGSYFDLPISRRCIVRSSYQLWLMTDDIVFLIPTLVYKSTITGKDDRVDQPRVGISL